MTKLLLYGRHLEQWVEPLGQAVPDVSIATATSEDDGISSIADADAFFGSITPRLLTATRQLRWIEHRWPVWSATSSRS